MSLGVSPSTMPGDFKGTVFQKNIWYGLRQNTFSCYCPFKWGWDRNKKMFDGIDKGSH
jgi:hypothetical protein